MTKKIEKKIIERECKNCGEMYDSNYKSCPHCGYNPVKHTLQTVLTCFVILCVVASCAISVVTVINQKTINEKLDYILSSQSTSDEDRGNVVDLESALGSTVYSNLSISDDLYKEEGLENFLKNLAGVTDYYIYFHSEDCSHCLEANVYIASYYNIPVDDSENPEYVFDLYPVFFATAEAAPGLFETYNVDSTPTLIHFIDGEQTESVVGPEDISNLLLTKVHEVRGD